jgi:hypothetical protein
MFFHVPIERELLLHPRLLGPHVTEHLKEKLLQTAEGSCSGRHGYIVSVTEIISQSKGQIREGTGITSFTMKFTAIVFRPFKACTRPAPRVARSPRTRGLGRRAARDWATLAQGQYWPVGAGIPAAGCIVTFGWGGAGVLAVTPSRRPPARVASIGTQHTHILFLFFFASSPPPRAKFLTP